MPKQEPKPQVLGSAAESSDPAVQILLAQREIADRNGDTKSVDEIDGRLAALDVAV